MIRVYTSHQAEPDMFHIIPDLDSKILWQQHKVVSLRAQLKLLEGVTDANPR